MSDLKSRLNAAAAAAKSEQQNAAAATAKYHETVLREYPRVVRELHDRVKNLLDGVEGLKFLTQDVSETLTYQAGSSPPGFTTFTVGTVRVPQWEVTFLAKRISFRPAGIGYFGIDGAIDVTTNNRTSLFRDNKIGLSRLKDDPTKWAAVVVTGERGQLAILTDEILKERLEQALLGH